MAVLRHNTKWRCTRTARARSPRRCICQLQTPELCGVCALKRQLGKGALFPSLSYDLALSSLKVAAAGLQFPRAAHWGTHCFRRGWGDEVLAAGGVPALFFSGGWRGVSAFGYASAKSRGAAEAAEFAVDFSDSSDGEMATP